MIEKSSKIYVAGHAGLAGSAMVRLLQNEGYTNLVYRTHSELDLTVQKDVEVFFEKERPDVVILFAAKVGGVYANKTYPADFILQNLQIETNVIGSALKYSTETLMFVASGTIYPRDAKHPLCEDTLLTGPFEPVNEPYALAKVTGIKLCDYISKQYSKTYFTVVPCNLYGMGDSYDPLHSHVVPSLIRKFHDAKINGSQEVVVWGTGKPIREFMDSDDLADGCLFLLRHPEFCKGQINVGSSEYTSIGDLVKVIADVVGFQGAIRFDTEMPDGAPIITMDSSLVRSFGWAPKTSLKEGLIKAYADYRNRAGTDTKE